MMIHNLKASFVVAAVSGLFILFGCKAPKTKIIQSPPHYDFSKPITNKLDLKLKEISGLVWDTDRDEFLAHADEAGTIYVLNKQNNAIVSSFSFGAKGDFEDVSLYYGVPYVLRSDGMITKIVRDSSGSFIRGVEVGTIDIPGSKDFETMYADTARKALILICKNCGIDDKSKVSAFAFYPDSIGFDNKPIFQINADKIKLITKEDTLLSKTSKFQPSAAAIHPVLNKLFVISSASSQLVIADKNGNVESVFELGKKLFPQPEGLTFKRTGDMFISNEGITSKATIHGFSYRP